MRMDLRAHHETCMCSHKCRFEHACKSLEFDDTTCDLNAQLKRLKRGIYAAAIRSITAIQRIVAA